MDSDARKRVLILNWYGKDIGQLEQVKFERQYGDFFDLFEAELRINSNEYDSEKVQRVSTVVSLIQVNPMVTKGSIMTRLKEVYPGRQENDLHEAIHQALRLWLLINSRPPYGIRTPSRVTEWTRDDEPLSEFVRGVFYRSIYPFSKPAADKSDFSDVSDIQARLTHNLTVVNIKKYTDMEITWSAWLPNHLQFNENYKELELFQYKQWLWDVLPLSQQLNPGAFPIPREVIEEAIMSLDYLLPSHEDRTAEYLEEEKAKLKLYSLGEPLAAHDRPKLRDFSFYHDRLIDVAYEYLNPPRSWKTIWKDKRNVMSFWTFWLGLLIFFFTLTFGIVASIVAGLQLKFAINPPK